MTAWAKRAGSSLALAASCTACATAGDGFSGRYDFEDDRQRLEVEIVETTRGVYRAAVRERSDAPWRELTATGSVVRGDAEPLRELFDRESPADRSSCLVGVYGRYTIPLVCRVPPDVEFGFTQNAGTGIRRISVRSGWVYPLATPAGLFPLELRPRSR